MVDLVNASLISNSVNKLRLSIEEFNTQAAIQNKRMLQFTVAITILTLGMLFAVGTQIYFSLQPTQSLPASTTTTTYNRSLETDVVEQMDVGQEMHVAQEARNELATPKAETHIKAMIDKYQSLSVYEDNGVTNIKYIKPDGSSFTDNKKFTTKYIENESLHFQWEEKRIFDDKLRTYAVWKDKTGIFTKSPYSKENEKFSNLASALASAKGLSSGLAWVIPRYLSPDIPYKPNLGANSSEVLKSEGNTIIIKLKDNADSTSKLFIDKNTYLLKKYENYQDFDNGTVIQQEAVFNVVNAK